MCATIPFMEHLINLIKEVGYFSYLLLFIIIFLESFPLTFFLPGDSLLFTTGFLASQGHFSLPLLVISLFVGSALGYIFSYKMGKKMRDYVLKSGDRFWFKKRHLDYTERFYNKYGAKTIIVGRFVPIVRSFGPTLAGAVEMNYEKFVRYTIFGGVFWSGGVTLGGYYLGRAIPDAHLYLTPIIIGIIVASLLPSVIEYIHVRRTKNSTI